VCRRGTVLIPRSMSLIARGLTVDRSASDWIVSPWSSRARRSRSGRGVVPGVECTVEAFQVLGAAASPGAVQVLVVRPRDEPS